MEKILFDRTYYQGCNHFFGGGEEYGDTVLFELLSRNDVFGGVFFYEKNPVDPAILKLLRDKGWTIHGIKELRNIAGIVKKYGYTTIYSPLPYSDKWSEVNLPREVRFVATYHGIRDVETALFKRTEYDFFNGNKENVFGCLSDSEYENQRKAIEKYKKSILAINNRRIITVSEHSKYAILHYIPEIGEEEIEVLYSPPKRVSTEIDNKIEKECLAKYSIKKKMFGLMIAADHYLKNVIRAVMAYDNLFDKGNVLPTLYKVIVTGVKDIEAIQDRVRNKNRFIFDDYIEAQDLEILYQNAQLFVFPSLNEGFGYPPLEAMKYGTVCACSANSSIPEICGDCVLYFNPFLIDEIAIRIRQSFDMKIVKQKENEMEKRLKEIEKRQKDDFQSLISIITER